MRIPTPLVSALASSTLWSTAMDCQPVARRLPREFEVEFIQEMSQVSAIRELSDGRVIVLDARERAVYLMDPRTKSASRIGREGAGPGEYVSPDGLAALAADTTLVRDEQNSRFLVLGAAGRILGTLPLFQIRPSEGVSYSLRVDATDHHGRFYTLLPTGLTGQDDKGTPIVRFDRATQRLDTVGRVQTAVQRALPTQQGAGGAGGMRAMGPYPERDGWTVAPNGSVAIVRAAPYRLEWLAPGGQVVRGDAVPFQPVPVTTAEKEEWRDQARSRGGGTLTTRSADGRVQQQRMPVPEPAEWPATKPAFVPPPMLASDGKLWVARSAAATDTIVAYDVFATSGALVERVSMPRDLRLAGFGRGTVYVVRKDADDLLRLQRYRLP
jgi:hypothetical protein